MTTPDTNLIEDTSFKIPTQYISAECLNRHCPECPNFDVCGGKIEGVEYVERQ